MSPGLRLSLVGIASPMRGGIAQYTAILAQELSKRNQVELIYFTRQYPSFLFPGKTQFEQGETGPAFPARPMVDSINPSTWLRAAGQVAAFRPDGLVYKYWMPFFAPAFGTIARRAKGRMGRRGLRTVMIVDNLIPHERRPLDLALTRWLMKATDAYIVQSGAVREDLLRLDPRARFLEVAHPVYNLFGDRIPKEEARRRLALEAGRPLLLFFGFVRPYKGLDLLLEALPLLKERWSAAFSGGASGTASTAPAAAGASGTASTAPPAAAGGPPFPRLLVLGEFYGGREETERLIRRLRLEEDVILQDRYVPNEEVGAYFSAADVVALPYRSATQSGIVQIAYQLERPVICTDVGGLSEVVLDGRTGLVVPPNDAGALAGAILRYYAGELEEGFVRAVRVEREKYSWDRMVEAVETLVREGEQRP
jgi:D-inositol-3-phosphate glycosyltransferase